MTDPRSIDEALNKPLRPEQYKPADLHIDRREGLRITWADGHKSHYSLAFLRKNCPCATCRTERETTEPAKSSLSLTILPANIDRAVQFANAKLVGNYAMQIVWADGHTTGIYDFRYLRAICPAENTDD